MRFLLLLSLLFVFAGNALHAVSLNAAKRFAKNQPASYENTCMHLMEVAREMLSAKQMLSDTPCVRIATKGTGAGLPVHITYPNIAENWKLEGYKLLSWGSLRWYSLEAGEHWSLDDKENLERIQTENLPKEEDWEDAEIVQKGREVQVMAILCESPDVEKLGKFRTRYKVSNDSKSEYYNINNKSFVRERGIARKEMAKQLKDGYAIIQFSVDGNRRYGWIKAESLLPQKTKKKKK